MRGWEVPNTKWYFYGIFMLLKDYICLLNWLCWCPARQGLCLWLVEGDNPQNHFHIRGSHVEEVIMGLHFFLFAVFFGCSRQDFCLGEHQKKSTWMGLIGDNICSNFFEVETGGFSHLVSLCPQAPQYLRQGRSILGGWMLCRPSQTPEPGQKRAAGHYPSYPRLWMMP